MHPNAYDYYIARKVYLMCALCGLNIIPPWLNMRSTGKVNAGTLAVKKFLMGTSTSHPSTSPST